MSRPPTTTSGRTGTARPGRALRVENLPEQFGHALGFAAGLGHVLGGAAVEHELVAVEVEPAGSVVLVVDRHHSGWADEQVVDVAADAAVAVAERDRVQHEPGRRAAAPAVPPGRLGQGWQ